MEAEGRAPPPPSRKNNNKISVWVENHQKWELPPRTVPLELQVGPRGATYGHTLGSAPAELLVGSGVGKMAARPALPSPRKGWAALPCPQSAPSALPPMGMNHKGFALVLTFWGQLWPVLPPPETQPWAIPTSKVATDRSLWRVWGPNQVGLTVWRRGGYLSHKPQGP